MIFTKHPQLMDYEELCKWAVGLIKRQSPESNYLDYKAAISVESKTNKIEIGKDVSSFANEYGSVLLYGVPEKDESGVPIPQDLSECGISIDNNLPEKVENILLDVVVPPLPELFIKLLTPQELNPKSLLLIYHPESWNKPHMLEGYKEGRYYRRGNFKSVPMNEREVEAAYLTRKVSLSHADNFFTTGDFRAIPNHGRFFRVILCPRFTKFRKDEMSENEFKQWLDNNPPDGRRGDWIPFLNGWAFLGYPDGNYYGKQYEIRLFHNGGFCFTMDLDYAYDEDRNLLNIKLIEDILKKQILSSADKAFELLKINGPLSLQFNLYNVLKLKAFTHPDFNAPESGTPYIEKPSINFIEEMSVDELRFNSDNVRKRLMDRLASLFGMWRK